MRLLEECRKFKNGYQTDVDVKLWRVLSKWELPGRIKPRETNQ